MKTALISLILALFLITAQAQNIVFSENFELPSGADSVQNTGNINFALTTQFTVNGLFADSAIFLANSDSAILQTSSFSTTGNYLVVLEFDQICKINIFDEALIEVSTDNGNSWITVDSNHYSGSGQMPGGNHFNSFSYSIWNPQNNSMQPTASWWKHEIFDLSYLAANQANVKIRFKLKDPNNNGSESNYGWLLDNIKVTASYGETIPPTITLTQTPPATMTTADSITVSANVQDASGLASVYLIYTINNLLTDSILMTISAPNIYTAKIPFPGFGADICYRVKALDQSYHQNIAYAPASGCNIVQTVYNSGGYVQIGTGTTTNSTSASPSPYAHYWTGNKSQYLIKASELVAAGATAGAISSVAFNVLTPDPPSTYGSAPSNSHCKNYTIKLKHTSSSTLSTTFETGLTTVYTHPNYGSTVGWNTHSFTQGFNWDGQSNLLVEICFDNYVNGSDYSNNAVAYNTQTSFTSNVYFESDNGSVCSQTSGYNTYYRPNMKFFIGSPSLTRDIGIVEIGQPNQSYTANTPQNLLVRFKNYGTNTITSATIHWKIDGTTMTPIPWTGNVQQDSFSAYINVGSINLSPGTHLVEVWTQNPNGNFDYNSANDAMIKTIFACTGPLSGSYSVGGSNANYNTMDEAVAALHHCGVSGPVIFQIDSGTYTGQWHFDDISGTNSINTVTFTSLSGDSSDVILQYSPTDTNTNFILHLKDANYINFNKLSFVNQSTNFGGLIILDTNSENITFENCLFSGSLTNSLSSLRNQIVVNSFVKNVIFDNNLFNNGNKAISISGNNIQKISILNNVFNQQKETAISAYQTDSLVLSKNHITQTNVSNPSGAIFLNNITGNLWINANYILTTNSANIIKIENTNLSSASAMVVNNMLVATGNVQNAVELIATKHINLYFNSFRLKPTGISAVINLKDSQSQTDNISIKNNSIYTDFGYQISSEFDLTTRSIDCDFNNYHSNNQIVFKNNNQQLAWNPWKTQTSKDQNSLSQNPKYISDYDLHSYNSILASGTPISVISADYDNHLRNSLVPAIGCDEVQKANYDLGIIEIQHGASSCNLSSNQPVTVAIKNFGTTTISGSYTINLRTKGSSSIISESPNQIITPNDTLYYSFQSSLNLSNSGLTHDSLFQIEAYVQMTTDTIAENDSLQSQIMSYYRPTAPLTNSQTINYGQTTTINISHPDSIFWYQNPTGISPFHTGNTYITPSLFDTTTYYVSAKGSPGGAFQIGNGSVSSNTATYPAPYSTISGGAKHQILVKASELKAQGMRKGYISSLSFDVESIGSQHTGYINNVHIALKNTNSQTVSTIGFESGLTTVVNNHLHQINLGLNQHQLDLPFYWDGLSNLLIQFTFTNQTIGNSNSFVQFKTDNIGYNCVSWFSANSSDQNTILSSTTPLGSSTTRPKLTITMDGNFCESTKSPATINVINYPSIDCGIESILSPTDTITAGQTINPVVSLINYGTSQLNTVKILYAIQGANTDTLTWFGALAPGTSTTVPLGSIVVGGGVQCLDVWTQSPNQLTDSFPHNDTAQSCYFACYNGVYTIGTNPQNSYNFNSFNQAISTVINATICGTIIFDIDSGNYNERLILPASSQLNPNTRIIFKSMYQDSTKVKLHFVTSTSEKSVVLVEGSYYEFENITISAANGSNYSRVIELANGASHNKFINCILEGKLVTSASTNYANVYGNGGAIDDNEFINNALLNSSYPFYLYGNSSDYQQRNKISGNQISDFFYFGPQLYYQDSLIFTGNTISNKASNTYIYGTYISYAKSMTFTGNKITLTPYSTVYGVRIQQSTSPATAPSLIANNFISINGSASGTWFGFWVQNCNFMDFVYNSLNINGGGTGASAFYQSSGTNIQILNNNFVVQTGSGYPMYITSPTAITRSDYNNLKPNGPNVAYWSGAKTSLTALTAASQKDSSSVSILPDFVSNTDLHLTSNSLSAKATSTNLVWDDIDGNPRTATPTIGAHEIAVIPYDVGITHVSFPDTTIEGTSYNLKIAVKNFGLNSATNFPIKYSLNGNTPATYSYSSILAPNQTDTVTISNFISSAGNSTLCCYTNLSSDTNFFNDSLCYSFFGKPIYDIETFLATNPQSGCNLTNEQVSFYVKNTGSSNIISSISINYQKDNFPIITESTNLNLNIDDSVLINFTTPVNLSVGQSDSIFQIKIWAKLIGDNVFYNDTTTRIIESYVQPNSPQIATQYVSYGTIAQIPASTSINHSLYWFSDSLSQNTIFIGDTFHFGPLYSDTAFWVEASTGNPLFHQFGTATTTNGTTSYPAPYSNYYGGTKHQMLVLASELDAIGLRPGQFIDSIAFDVVEIGQGFSGNLNNFSISMGLTNSTNLTTAGFISGLNTVFQTNMTQIDSGWNIHAFTNPIAWDGVSNLIIQTVYNNGNIGAYNTAVIMSHSLTSWNSSSYYRADAASDSLMLNISNPQAVSNKRPNMKLWASRGGCTSQRVKAEVIITAQPSCDVALLQITKPLSAVGLSTSEPITIKVKNNGSSNQTSIPVAYQINSGTIIRDTIPGILTTGQTTNFTFSDSADLSQTGVYHIMSWTETTCDTINYNDTISKTVENLPVSYCNGFFLEGTNFGDYISNVSLLSGSNTSLATPFPSYSNYGSVLNATLVSNNSYELMVSVASPLSKNYVAAWIDFNRDGDFNDAYEKIGEMYLNAQYTNTDTLTFNTPIAVNSGSTRMRVRTVYNTAGLDPCYAYTWGETEDYQITIVEQSTMDAGVHSILYPSMFVPNKSIQAKIAIQNYGSDTLTQIPISLEDNNQITNSELWIGILPPGDTVHFTFQSFTAFDGNNKLCIKTSLQGDLNATNDEKCMNFYFVPEIQPPFFDNFEGADLWHPDSVKLAWERGIPSGNVINTAYSPTNAWMTLLDTNYANNETYFLYSPKFITAQYPLDSLIFWHQFHTETYGDICAIEYFSSFGIWITLGTLNDPKGTNWYNTFFTEPGWTGNSQGWVRSAYNLNGINNLAAVTQFRFVLRSNTVYNPFDGWAIDNFEITIKQLAKDAEIVSILHPSDSALAGMDIFPKIQFRNNGTQPLDSVQISIYPTAQNPIMEVWIGQLNPGDTTTYTFTTPYKTPAINHTLFVDLSTAGDIYQFNDSISKKINIKPFDFDIGVTQINMDSTHFSPKLYHSIITNLGTQNVQQFDYHFFINQNQIVTKTWQGNLQSNDTAHIQIFSNFPLAFGNNQICGYVVFNSDQNHKNDTMCASIVYSSINNSNVNNWFLEQNIPNPFKLETQIPYEIPVAGICKFTILDLFGRVLYQTEDKKPAGKSVIKISNLTLNAGVYIYKMEYNNQILSRRMIVR